MKSKLSPDLPDPVATLILFFIQKVYIRYNMTVRSVKKKTKKTGLIALP